MKNYLAIGISQENKLFTFSRKIKLDSKFNEKDTVEQLKEESEGISIDRVLLVGVDDEGVPVIVNDFTPRT